MTQPARRLQTGVLVVGSGPGGAVTALRLTEAGHQVTIAEEGAWIDPAALVPYSLEEMTAKYRNRGMNVMLGLPPISYVEGRCAGGGSEVNSGLYHRLPPEVADRWRRDFLIADLDPDELDGHAASIEAALSVSPVPGALPAMSAVLADGAGALGWEALEVPRWVRYPPAADSYRRGEKQTMTRTLLPRALELGAHLLTRCTVERLVLRSGRAVGAACRWQENDDGVVEPLVIEADHVVVCAGAVQTPALLQRSGIRRRVGRGLKAHPTIKLAARFAEPFDDDGLVPMHQVKEFAPDITLGGSASRPGYVAMTMADGSDSARSDAADLRGTAVYYAAVRSDGSGRVVAVPGLRAPLVAYGLTEGDLSRLARGAIALGEVLFAAGAQRLYPSITGAEPIDRPDQLHRLWKDVTRLGTSLMTVHLFATVRMSERRELAAADSFGRVHGLTGLSVNDASLLPDAPGINPQGAVMAIAERNVRRLVATLAS